MTDLPDGFDPQKPFVAQDGLEYQDFAHYLREEPVDNGRNRKIKEYWAWRKHQNHVFSQAQHDDWIWNFYTCYHSSGNPFAANNDEAEARRIAALPQLCEWRFRAGAERWRAQRTTDLLIP